MGTTASRASCHDIWVLDPLIYNHDLAIMEPLKRRYKQQRRWWEEEEPPCSCMQAKGTGTGQQHMPKQQRLGIYCGTGNDLYTLHWLQRGTPNKLRQNKFAVDKKWTAIGGSHLAEALDLLWNVVESLLGDVHDFGSTCRAPAFALTCQLLFQGES